MPSSCLCHSLLFPFPRPRCDPFWTLVCPFFSSCVVWKSAKTGTWNWKQQCRQPKGGAKSFQPGSNAWAAVFRFGRWWILFTYLHEACPKSSNNTRHQPETCWRKSEPLWVVARPQSALHPIGLQFDQPATRGAVKSQARGRRDKGDSNAKKG